jgi:hypothetical protein
VSTLELVADSIIISFLIGALVGVLLYQEFVSIPAQRNADRERDRLREQSRRHIQHLGTPYIPTRPGLRLVHGEPFYSSAWLNDDASVNP